MLYSEKDFYQVEKDLDGNKIIHIYGYLYPTEGGADPGQNWRHVQYCGLYIKLEDMGNYNEFEEVTKQYIGDLTESEAQKVMDNYFERPVKELPIANVSSNTPEGFYVDCKPTENKIVVSGDRNNEFIKAYQSLPIEQREILNKVLQIELWDGYPFRIYENK